MNIHFYENDLPDGLDLGNIVAVDTETTGLRPIRDRLCLVQLSKGDGECHLVRMARDHHPSQSPNLIALLEDSDVMKIFHFARFDVAMMLNHLGALAAPLYCTKIASKIVRTYADRHGLKDICKELLGIEISKQEQLSYWGADELSQAQLKYAATDVLYLHQLKAILDERLEREERIGLAYECFQHIPTRAYLDLTYGEEFDIFAH